MSFWSKKFKYLAMNLFSFSSILKPKSQICLYGIVTLYFICLSFVLCQEIQKINIKNSGIDFGKQLHEGILEESEVPWLKNSQPSLEQIKELLQHVEHQIIAMKKENLNMGTKLSSVSEKQASLLKITTRLINRINIANNDIEVTKKKLEMETDLLLELTDHVLENDKKISTRIKSDFVTLRKEILDIIFNYQVPINCPEMSYRFGAECLSYEQVGKNWNDSRANCKDLGGDLATLDFSELPLELLPKVIPELERDLLNVKHGLYASIFIGGYALKDRNKWKWITGYPVEMNDSRWFEYQPDMTLNDGKHCLSLKIANKQKETSLAFGFDDISCDLVSTALCEFPPTTD